MSLRGPPTHAPGWSMRAPSVRFLAADHFLAWRQCRVFCDESWAQAASRHALKGCSRQCRSEPGLVSVLVSLQTDRQTELTSMAKRRAEDTLLHDFPSKKYCRAFCKVSMHLGSMDPTGGVSKPSLLALLGSRGRKRPHYSEDLNKEGQEEETAPAVSPCRKDTRMHAASVLSEQTSGSFHDRRSTNSASTKSKKRARDSGSEIVPEDKEKVS